MKEIHGANVLNQRRILCTVVVVTIKLNLSFASKSHCYVDALAAILCECRLTLF